MKRAQVLPDRKRPLIFAHRGSVTLAPENTMAAFKLAREWGIPGIELDVHHTLDGKLVVAHDDNFLRTAPFGNNGDGKNIEELNYDEIKNIDVGSFLDSKWRAQRPPLLEEVLEEFCPAMYVDIELKSSRVKKDVLPLLAAEKLKSMRKEICSSVTISSFNPFCAGRFRKIWRAMRGLYRKNNSGENLPEIPTAILWINSNELPLILRRGLGRLISGSEYLKPNFKHINKLSMYDYKKINNHIVIPWTVDDPALAEKLIKLGCDGIVTNNPREMMFLQ